MSDSLYLQISKVTAFITSHFEIDVWIISFVAYLFSSFAIMVTVEYKSVINPINKLFRHIVYGISLSALLALFEYPTVKLFKAIVIGAVLSISISRHTLGVEATVSKVLSGFLMSWLDEDWKEQLREDLRDRISKMKDKKEDEKRKDEDGG